MSGEVQASTLVYSNTGTYIINSEGQVIITLPNHGISNNDVLYVKYITGGGKSRLVDQQEVLTDGPDHLRLTESSSEATQGQVLVSRLFFDKSGTYTMDQQKVITVLIPSHGYPDGTDLYLRFSSGPGISSPVVIERILHSGGFRVIKKNNPGGFYSEFGVSIFHHQLYYGAGVKVYVIDEGFNDVDLNTPGIQTTTDLAEFTVVDLATPGAGGGGLSHGGLVCALLGASRRNGAGIIGVCPDAQLFIADVDDINGSIFISRVVEAIDDAISRGVDIINMSLGTTSDIPSLRSAVQRALQANILVFASAGNSGQEIYEYPSAYPGVISVASVNIRRQASSFNTRNDRVALYAPGEKYPLPSPFDTQDVVYVNGTSFSSPFAAGLAALYLSRRRGELSNPTYRCGPEELIGILQGEGYLATANTLQPETTSNSGAGILLGVLLLLALLAGVAYIGGARGGVSKGQSRGQLKGQSRGQSRGQSTHY